MSSTETAVTTTAKAESATKPVMFTGGEPESVDGGRAAIMEYAECMNNGRWYEPPVSFSELARTLRVGAHHESALRFKVNVLTSTFKPSQWLSAETSGARQWFS